MVLFNSFLFTSSVLLLLVSLSTNSPAPRLQQNTQNVAEQIVADTSHSEEEGVIDISNSEERDVADTSDFDERDVVDTSDSGKKDAADTSDQEEEDTFKHDTNKTVPDNSDPDRNDRNETGVNIYDPEEEDVFKPYNREGRLLLTSGKIADVTLVAGGDSGVSGSLVVSQLWPWGVIISGTISGLSNGFHGFHIHQTGDIGNDCKAAGGHFNPDQVNHGSPISLTRHAGDLGNIFAFYGTANPYIWDKKISLGDGGATDIAGRAVVVHGGVDDLGLGTGEAEAGSLATGNAGARVACGVITLRK